jgi:hypothetical protein
MTMMPQEQEIRQLVRETLTQVGRIENGHLTQLMPTIPAQKRPFWPTISRPLLTRQLALVAVMFVLLLGGWHWSNSGDSAIWQAPPTTTATATTTQTPNATQTQAKIVATETAVNQPPTPAIIPTPISLPTPVAAVPINSN